MKDLKIEDLLRYGFCGGLFLITLILTHPDNVKNVLETKNIGQATLVVGSVLLLGSLIYTLHRALTYPLILFRAALLATAAFGIFPFEWALLNPFRQPQIEEQLDRWRLDVRRSDSTLHSVIDHWGAEVHFLYCSSLGIFTAIYLGSFLPTTYNLTARRVLVRGAVFILFAGLYHHFRLLRMISSNREGGVVAITPSPRG